MALLDPPLDWRRQELKKLRSTFIEAYDLKEVKYLVEEVVGPEIKEEFPEQFDDLRDFLTRLLVVLADKGCLLPVVEKAKNEVEHPKYREAFAAAIDRHNADVAAKGGQSAGGGKGDGGGQGEDPKRGELLGAFVVIVLLLVLIGASALWPEPEPMNKDSTPTITVDPPPVAHTEMDIDKPEQTGELLEVSWTCSPAANCESFKLQYCLDDEGTCDEGDESNWRPPQSLLEEVLAESSFQFDVRETNRSADDLVGKTYRVRVAPYMDNSPSEWVYSPETEILDRFPPNIEVLNAPELLDEQLTLTWQAADTSGIKRTIVHYCLGSEGECVQTCEGDAWKPLEEGVNNESRNLTLGPINYSQSYHFCLTATDTEDNTAAPVYSGPWEFQDVLSPDIRNFTTSLDQLEPALRVRWTLHDNNQVDIIKTKLESCEVGRGEESQCGEDASDWKAVDSFSAEEVCKVEQWLPPSRQYVACSFLFPGVTGSTYRFRVSAADHHGNSTSRLTPQSKEIVPLVHVAGDSLNLQLQLPSGETLTIPLMFIPAAEDFVLGSEGLDTKYLGLGQGDKTPVNLPAYWIDKLEVTNALFAAFLNDERLKEGFSERTYLDRDNTLIERSEGGIYGPREDACERYNVEDPENKIEDGMCDDHPVVGVTWEGANEYCRWVSFEATGGELQGRLPTEHEWENAAKDGIQEYAYPWGKVVRPNAQPGRQILNYNRANLDDVPLLPKLDETNAIEHVNTDQAWIQTEFYSYVEELWYADKFVGTAPVWEFSDDESRYKVLNMIGNVAEWTETDPKGDELNAVVRGFSYTWEIYPPYIEIRTGHERTATRQDLGFRCAYPYPEPVLQE